jgi:hypothetical protein
VSLRQSAAPPGIANPVPRERSRRPAQFDNHPDECITTIILGRKVLFE